MKTICISLFIISLFVAGSSAQRIDCNDSEKIRQEIIDEINAISREISPLLTPKDRDYLERRLDEIDERVNCLAQPVYSTYTLYPMLDADFNLILVMIDNEKFENDKIAIVQRSFMNKFVTVGQLTRLLEKFSFEENRLKVVEIVYPTVLDNENASLLYDYFIFNSSKEKLNQIILKNGL